MKPNSHVLCEDSVEVITSPGSEEVFATDSERHPRDGVESQLTRKQFDQKKIGGDRFPYNSGMGGATMGQLASSPSFISRQHPATR